MMTPRCEEFEKLIILESELSNSEKEILAGHVATCHACRAQYDLHREAGHLIFKSAEKVMTPPARLTGMIMDQIEASQREIFPAWLTGLFGSRTLELSLATVCTMLLVVFAVELAGPVMRSATPDFPESKGAIQIDSRHFRNALMKYRVRQPVAATSACLSPLKTKAEYLDCLKSKLK